MANKSQSIYQINNTAVKTHENCEDGKKIPCNRQKSILLLGGAESSSSLISWFS